MNPERVSLGEEGEGYSMLMDRNRKGAGINSEEAVTLALLHLAT